jgi:hypothetical protein
MRFGVVQVSIYYKSTFFDTDLDVLGRMWNIVEILCRNWPQKATIRNASYENYYLKLNLAEFRTGKLA